MHKYPSVWRWEQLVSAKYWFLSTRSYSITSYIGSCPLGHPTRPQILSPLQRLRTACWSVTQNSCSVWNMSQNDVLQGDIIHCGMLCNAAPCTVNIYRPNNNATKPASVVRWRHTQYLVINTLHLHYKHQPAVLFTAKIPVYCESYGTVFCF